MLRRPGRALAGLAAASTLAACGVAPRGSDAPAPGAAATAPAPPPRRLPDRPDLAELLAAALGRSPALREAGAEVDLARVDRRGTLLALLPTLEANGGYTGSSTTHGQPDFAPQNGASEYTATIGARLSLTSWLTYGSERRATDAAEDVATAEVAVRRRELAARVREAYHEALRGGAQAAALAALEAREGELVDGLEAQRREGLAAEIDLHRAALARASVQGRRATADGGRARALAALGALLRVAPLADVAPLDSASEAALGSATPLGPVAEAALLARARERSPELARARAELARAAVEVDRAAQGHWPTIDARVDGGWDSTTAPDAQNPGWSASLGVRVPIFEWGRVGREVERAELRRDQAQARLEQAEADVQRDARAALLDRDLALAALRRSQAVVADSARIVVQSRVGWGEGALTSLELLSAWEAATEAELALIDARADLAQAEARLARFEEEAP